jgi:hypothetical protein
LHSIRVWSVNIRTWCSTPHISAGKGLAKLPRSSPQLFPTVPIHAHAFGRCVFVPRAPTAINCLEAESEEHCQNKFQLLGGLWGGNPGLLWDYISIIIFCYY